MKGRVGKSVNTGQSEDDQMRQQKSDGWKVRGGKKGKRHKQRKQNRDPNPAAGPSGKKASIISFSLFPPFFLPLLHPSFPSFRMFFQTLNSENFIILHPKGLIPVQNHWYWLLQALSYWFLRFIVGRLPNRGPWPLCPRVGSHLLNTHPSWQGTHWAKVHTQACR